MKSRDLKLGYLSSQPSWDIKIGPKMIIGHAASQFLEVVADNERAP